MTAISVIAVRMTAIQPRHNDGADPYQNPGNDQRDGHLLEQLRELWLDELVVDHHPEWSERSADCDANEKVHGVSPCLRGLRWIFRPR
jgi:hypothetical protein